MNFLAQRIAKNGPELHALLTGGLPYFITARSPVPLADAIPVFCYHVVSASVFKQDLQFLKDNEYHTVTADQLLSWIAGNASPKQKTVVLTFDDGADNFYRVAFPLLRAFQQKAVLFISPGLHRSHKEEPLRQERPCTWEELQEMHVSGFVDIQSHSWEHRSLQHWPTPLPLTGIDNQSMQDRRGRPLDIKEDVTKARHELEKRFTKSVTHLAWPCYYSESRSIQLAEEAGYKGFWTGTLPRIPLITPGHDPHKIVRISGEFLQRLPGNRRKPLTAILATRYKNAYSRLRNRHATHTQNGAKHCIGGSDVL